MAVILINPNSTATMTETMLAAARRAVPDRVVEGWTSLDGPPAIQGAEDGERATGPLMRLVQKADGAEALVIGCFDDTALAAAVRMAPCPVIGIGQAAFHLCALRGWRFAVVTTLSVSVPVIEGNIARYGLVGACAGVRASDVPVLALEERPHDAAAAIRAEAEAAYRDDGIDALILGCAGMSRITQEVRAILPIPVIDPIEAAMGCIGWLSDHAAQPAPRNR